MEHSKYFELWSTHMGREVVEGLRFLASLPLAGTGQREGGGFSCINKRIISHPVKSLGGLLNFSFRSAGRSLA